MVKDEACCQDETCCGTLSTGVPHAMASGGNVGGVRDVGKEEEGRAQFVYNAAVGLGFRV